MSDADKIDLEEQLRNAEKTIRVYQSMMERRNAEMNRLGEKCRNIIAVYVAGGAHDYSNCEVDECEACGVYHCPYGEGLHLHHDGCPACHNAAAQEPQP